MPTPTLPGLFQQTSAATQRMSVRPLLDAVSRAISLKYCVIIRGMTCFATRLHREGCVANRASPGRGKMAGQVPRQRAGWNAVQMPYLQTLGIS